MRFLLVCVTNRDITVTKHLSYASAYEKMKAALLEVMKITKEELEDIIKHQNGQAYNFSIEKYSAWADADDGYVDCDWSIFELSKVQQG